MTLKRNVKRFSVSKQAGAWDHVNFARKLQSQGFTVAMRTSRFGAYTDVIWYS